MISIKQISAAQTYPVRKEVLRKNIDLPYKLAGDFNEDTFHLGAFKGEELVGVVSFMKVSLNSFTINKQYQLRGMATIAEVRGEGFGEALVKEAISILSNKKQEIIWCNARELAVGFYKKCGFKVMGDVFDIKKVGPHYKMYIKLNNTYENDKN